MIEPWSKFFWSDYEADEGLRVCSLAAQGLWMRMLCLMARATPKGELRIATEPCTVQDLSKLVGESEETVGALLGELRRRGVFSTTRVGVIFSRRIRKDAEISRKRAESGAKGGRASLGKHEVIDSLLEQKQSKGESKSEAPEARSHMLEKKEPPNPQPEVDPPTNAQQGRNGQSEYVFAGGTIRLNAKNFEEWRLAYHAIPDLKAELRALDDWLQKPENEPKRKGWFCAISGNLNRKHQEYLAKGTGPPSGNDPLVDIVLARKARKEAERNG